MRVRRTLALMRHRLYSYEWTRYRRAKLRTDSGYAGGLLLTVTPYWYRIPSTFTDPSVLDARPATFVDNTRRASLAALRDPSVFLIFVFFLLFLSFAFNRLLQLWISLFASLATFPPRVVFRSWFFPAAEDLNFACGERKRMSTGVTRM